MISVSGEGKADDMSEHRCGRCWGPYGKSAIPCPNETAPTGHQFETERLKSISGPNPSTTNPDGLERRTA